MATSQVLDIKAKNVQCLRTLISIAQTDGNYLGEAWYEVSETTLHRPRRSNPSWQILKCISQLELAQLFGIHGNKKRVSMGSAPAQNTQSSKFSLPFDHFFSTEKSKVPQTIAVGKDPHPRRIGQSNKRLQSIQNQIQETSSQSMIVSVDRVFSGSARLDGDAIGRAHVEHFHLQSVLRSLVAFVRSLCHVSVDELNAHPPRMFSLLKIVEISYYNMGRIRLQWSRIWEIVGEHFNRVRSYRKRDVRYSIGCRAGRTQSDARRVLLCLGLPSAVVDEISRERRISQFSLSERISQTLRTNHEEQPVRISSSCAVPSNPCRDHRRSTTIRDMVVRCITHFVHSQAKNIRSGWKNIFSVFQMAASDSDVQIVELAFQTCAHIIGRLVVDFVHVHRVL